MDRRENVIRGLQCTISPNPHCRKCEYFVIENKGVSFCDRKSLMLDALELLKAQEPRVMTLDELKKNVDNPCWFESHGTYMGYVGFWIIPYAFTAWRTMYYVFPLMQINERGDLHYSELSLSAYNKVWRCWTSRPAEEQRKAVKWE